MRIVQFVSDRQGKTVYHNINFSFCTDKPFAMWALQALARIDYGQHKRHRTKAEQTKERPAFHL